MKLRSAHPAGWAVFESQRHRDERGWLAESMRLDALRAHAGAVRIVQQNLSYSRRGVLRGLHYQLGTPQGKLVQVVQGRVHDVVVDLRRASPFFGRWFAIGLGADDGTSLWVPPGYAHGFLALEDALVLYAQTQPRDAAGERAIRWNSPALAIDWPLEGADPVLSERDREAPLFDAQRTFDDSPAAGAGHGG